MSRITRRTNGGAGVRFCDGCAAVSTPEQRAAARIERVRTHLAAAAGPR